MKLCLCLFLLLLGALPANSATAWDLNDVSYLLPLPKVVGQDALLRLDTPAKAGGLLPSAMLAKFPMLAMHLSKEEILASLRVIGVRIDPCFPLPTPQSCQRQIRLVWQPFDKDPWNPPRTVDAALHSFYTLTDDEFVSLLRDISAWKKQYPVNTAGLPLQIHPAWGADGEFSPALMDFQKIIVKYAGVSNLIRVTTMVLRGAGDMWAFAAFQPVDGNLVNINIPRINKPSQAFANFAIPFDHFQNAQMGPTPQGPDTIKTLILDSEDLKQGHDQEIVSELQVLTRIEDPRVFSPENMDCVTCHITQQVRNWAVPARADLKLAELWDSLRYQNYSYNLNNVTAVQINTRNIRAFGYFGRNPALSQRVINESAVVADSINAWLK
jgi:hypothetical protein